MSTVTYAHTAALVSDHHITPHRCDRCQATAAEGASWQARYDDGTDPLYIGFQCQNCGNIQGMSRGNILRRVRTAERHAEQW